MANVLVATVVINLLLYSMWGSVGGWALGRAYLIPSYAILGIGIGIILYRMAEESFFSECFSWFWSIRCR